MSDAGEFPIGFPLDMGTPLLAPEDLRSDTDPELAYERRVDMCATGLGLLLNQVQDKPRLRAVACGLLDGMQDVENAIWQLFTERWIDTANGGQLDLLGGLLVFPRAGRLDETYRAFLRARVRVLRSNGSWPALVGVLEAIGVALADGATTYQADHPAAFVVRLHDTLPAEVTGADVFEMLEAARAGGVRLTLVAPVASIERTFRCSNANDYLVGPSARGFGDVSNPGDGGSLAGVHASSVEI